MRTVYFSLSGAFMIVGLIVCFENIMIPSNGLMIGFQSMTGSIFFPLLMIMLIGFIGGIFSGFALMSKKIGSVDDDLDMDL